jgi:hypothetical protein
MSTNRSNSVLQYDQSFVVNGYLLSGVDSVSISHSTPLENSLVLGTSFGYNLNNPFQAEISLNRNLLYSDPLLNFTGDSSFSGSFKYNGKTYGFTSGFLTRYGVSCSVGDIPTVSCSISVYGKLEPSLEALPFEPHPPLYIPSPRSIVVSGNDTSTNRVKSFSYELNVNRQAVFSLDSYRSVDEVVFLPPINVSASVDFDAVNMTPDNYQAFSTGVTNRYLDIKIKDRNSNNQLVNLIVPNIQEVSQELSATSEAQLTITNNYIGYLE